MTDRITMNHGLVVGKEPPTAEVIAELASEGFGSVVNLRLASEENQLLSPGDEGEAVTATGMRYLHFPVGGVKIDEETIVRFRAAIATLPGPVFVHCASGRRAQALTSTI